MIRLLFLLLIIFNLTYGQDTLAVIEPKYGAEDVEMFFAGDTSFVRMIYDHVTTAKQGSIGIWYTGENKLADVDLAQIRSQRLLGVHCQGSTTYYYAYREAGKKTEISGYRSESFGPATHAFTTTFPGVPSSGFIRNGHFAIFFWERKASTVHLIEYDGGDLAASSQIKIPLDLKSVREGDVSFIAEGGATRITADGVPLKLFLDGDRFSAVFDDIWMEYRGDETKTLFKTHVFRKDLGTGKEDIDVFFSTDRYAFKGFIHKSNLYRFASADGSSKLTVHDLDNDKVLHELTLNQKLPAIEHYGAEHKIAKVSIDPYRNIMSSDTDVGILVDEHKGQVIVTAGFISHYKGSFTLLGYGSPVVAPGIGILGTVIGTTLMQLQDDPAYSLYTYFQGSPETKFEAVQPPRKNDFVKIRMDEYELQNLSHRHLSYTGHFAGKNYWVGAYKVFGIPRYVFIKFDKTP